jgi:hypothetical protein
MAMHKPVVNSSTVAAVSCPRKTLLRENAFDVNTIASSLIGTMGLSNPFYSLHILYYDYKFSIL